jgi:hypothetical protein
LTFDPLLSEPITCKLQPPSRPSGKTAPKK